MTWLPDRTWWLGGTPFWRENHPFTHAVGGAVMYVAVRILLLGLHITPAWWGAIACVTFLSAYREEVGNVEQPWRAPYEWKPGDIGDIVFATLGAGTVGHFALWPALGWLARTIVGLLA